ncbi:hypothetical protein KO317_00445 [Candidatus Micrarchaeota archaeon]|jgi:hypothetical protein|nr:hypothetical protein [Candidatus Micrarchaeota archaeon]
MPRYLEKRTFDLYYKENIKNMKAITIHELLHFIYFDKWKKIFPKDDISKFEAPNKIWHLSEMVPKIILNDKKIQHIFKYPFSSYKEYDLYLINGKPVVYGLQEIYEKRKNFTDFLKKSRKFVDC